MTAMMTPKLEYGGMQVVEMKGESKLFEEILVDDD